MKTVQRSDNRFRNGPLYAQGPTSCVDSHRLTDYSAGTNYSRCLPGKLEEIMSIRLWLAAAVTGISLVFALMAGPVVAHHASSPFYDPERRVEIEGTVTRFVFRNPHAFLYVDVSGADGSTTEWQVELGAPVSLRRTGWTPDALSVGTLVKVAGQPSRAEGSHGIGGPVRMTRPDGRPIVEGGRVTEETPPPQ
jgi:hypothetical protein